MTLKSLKSIVIAICLIPATGCGPSLPDYTIVEKKITQRREHIDGAYVNEQVYYFELRNGGQRWYRVSKEIFDKYQAGQSFTEAEKAESL